MKKNVKNFIAKLLVLCMVVSLLPAFALTAKAVDDNPYGFDKDAATPEVVETKSEVDSTGTAKSEVTEANMNAAIANAMATAETEGKAPAVNVQVETAAGATGLEVDLPADSLEKLAEEGGSFGITSDVASVVFDSEATSALVGQAAGGSISIEVTPAEDKMSAAQTGALAKFESESGSTAKAYDLSVFSGGQAIHGFGSGKVNISLPFDGNDPEAYYLSDRGLIEHLIATLANGVVTFATNHNSTYVISDGALTAETEFPDVSAGQWYSDFVNWAVINDITVGYDDGTFGPAGPCTRAQFVTFLWRAAGKPTATINSVPFTDVTSAIGADFYNAILWGYENGIALGNGDGTFGVNDNVLRGQAVTFMRRYAANESDLANETGAPNFTDVKSTDAAVADYYAAIGWAVANGITVGNSEGSTTFGPLDGCQRAEMVTFLYRLFMLTE